MGSDKPESKIACSRQSSKLETAKHFDSSRSTGEDAQVGHGKPGCGRDSGVAGIPENAGQGTGIPTETRGRPPGRDRFLQENAYYMVASNPGR